MVPACGGVSGQLLRRRAGLGRCSTGSIAPEWSKLGCDDEVAHASLGRPALGLFRTTDEVRSVKGGKFPNPHTAADDIVPLTVAPCSICRVPRGDCSDNLPVSCNSLQSASKDS
jgi:hypothetical protein